MKLMPGEQPESNIDVLHISLKVVNFVFICTDKTALTYPPRSYTYMAIFLQVAILDSIIELLHGYLYLE